MNLVPGLRMESGWQPYKEKGWAEGVKLGKEANESAVVGMHEKKKKKEEKSRIV